MSFHVLSARPPRAGLAGDPSVSFCTAVPATCTRISAPTVPETLLLGAGVMIVGVVGIAVVREFLR